MTDETGPSVVLVGTLDTKGREYAFVRDRLRAEGIPVTVIDVGVLGDPPFAPDVTSAEVAWAAGTVLEDLRFAREGSDTRAVALAAMGRGATAIVRERFDAGLVLGVMGLGGSGGSTVVSDVLRSLPVGVPKLLVSTLASGDVRTFVGTSDVTLVHPVTDVAGLNRVSRRVLANAANAMAGMARFRADGAHGDAPLVAITMFGVTTPGVLAIQAGLEEMGFETIVFHAVGSGGRAMEEMIDAGLIDAVVDVTTSELTDELLGGAFGAGPHRLEAAGRQGIPQVVIPGALEVLNFGPRDTVPARYDTPDRPLVVHNPSVCAVRTNAEESHRLGELLAVKVNAATGPSAVVLPTDGLSKYELPGGPFRNLEADKVLFGAIRATLRPDIVLREVAANVNDAEFAAAVLDVFRERWTRVRSLPVPEPEESR
ncbi:MAG: Tm-1-like ATP-binding domain-containing protein [Chloroflexi bacterium]|nr:Tm-1-like ATP-binding domain-containing protein [Chloroflexota bacterium]